jgi:hypothetical protein
MQKIELIFHLESNREDKLINKEIFDEINTELSAFEDSEICIKNVPDDENHLDFDWETVSLIFRIAASTIKIITAIIPLIRDIRERIAVKNSKPLITIPKINMTVLIDPNININITIPASKKTISQLISDVNNQIGDEYE